MYTYQHKSSPLARNQAVSAEVLYTVYFVEMLPSRSDSPVTSIISLLKQQERSIEVQTAETLRCFQPSLKGNFGMQLRIASSFLYLLLAYFLAVLEVEYPRIEEVAGFFVEIVRTVRIEIIYGDLEKENNLDKAHRITWPLPAPSSRTMD